MSPTDRSLAVLSARLPTPAPGTEGCGCVMSFLVVRWWRHVQGKRISSLQRGESFTGVLCHLPVSTCSDGFLLPPAVVESRFDVLCWVAARWDAEGCSFLNLKPNQQGSGRAHPSDPNQSWCFLWWSWSSGDGEFEDAACCRGGECGEGGVLDGCSSAEAACCAVRLVLLRRGWFPGWLLCH